MRDAALSLPRCGIGGAAARASARSIHERDRPRRLGEALGSAAPSGPSCASGRSPRSSATSPRSTTSPRHLQGRAVLPARRLGLRQVDAAAHARRLREPDRGQDRDRRPGHDRGAALRAAGQHDVPVLRAVPAHDRGAERRLRPEARRHAGPRRCRPRRRNAEAGQARASSPRRKPHQLSGGQRQRVALARASSSGRSSCCSTSRSARSTRSCARRPSSSWSRSRRRWASPSSSSPTTRKRR